MCKDVALAGTTDTNGMGTDVNVKCLLNTETWRNTCKEYKFSCLKVHSRHTVALCLNSLKEAKNWQVRGFACNIPRDGYTAYYIMGAATSALSVSYPLVQHFVLGQAAGIFGDLWIFGWILYVLA